MVMKDMVFQLEGVDATDLEEGVVSPGGVGYDINCGVRLIRNNLMEKHIRNKIPELINALFEAIPSGVRSKGRIRLTESELGTHWALKKGYG
jgi:tRNA-splicing ligase RtcB